MRVWRHASTSDGPCYWRGWLHVQQGSSDVLTLRMEAGWLGKASHAGFSIEEDEDSGGAQVFVGLWRLVNVWVSAGSPALVGWRYRRQRARGVPYKHRPELNIVNLRFHNRAVWWEVWHPKHEWHRGTPRWRHGSFQAWDWLAGKTQYTSQVLADVEAEVAMPEASYPCRVKVERQVWSRKRWPAMVRAGYSVDMLPWADGRPGYVPVPGKGENSWDCGPDGTFGQSGPLPDRFTGLRATDLPTAAERALVDEAVAEAVRQVRDGTLETRRRRGVRPDYAEAI